MFNKLKQQFAHIKDPKKKKTPIDELAERGFDIDLSNLWKYSSQELQSYINSYEKLFEKLKKHLTEINEENSSIKEKLGGLEIEKNQALSEKQQFKLQVDSICNILTAESKEKEKYKIELEALKTQKINNMVIEVEKDRKAFEECRNKLETMENSIKEKEDIGVYEKIVSELEPFKTIFNEISMKYNNSDMQHKANNIELEEKYETLLINFEKTEKIKQELESDLIKMSEKLSIAKVENLNIFNALNELKTKVKAEEIKNNDLSLEKRALTEENELIKDKINSVVSEKTKLEENSSNGNRELKIKYEESKENIAKLEEYIKLQDEKSIFKIRDLENKLIQERLKLDQKVRDYTKIEEQYNQAKSDLLTQIEAINKANEKIQLLDMKITNDKKTLKEEKKKYKALNKQLLEVQNKIWSENSDKDNKIKELEAKIQQIYQKTQMLEEERQGYLNKDLEVQAQLLKIQELNNENEVLKKEQQTFLEKNQHLEKDLQNEKNYVQTLKEKREASLHEIQKLSSEVQSLKALIQVANTPKMRPMVQQGFSGEVMESISQKNIDLGKSSMKKEEILTPLKPMDNSAALPKSSTFSRKHEAKYMTSTKKELEVIYRELIELLLPFIKDNEINKVFCKIEKRVNDAIRRAQDHIDNLEDI